MKVELLEFVSLGGGTVGTGKRLLEGAAERKPPKRRRSKLLEGAGPDELADFLHGGGSLLEADDDKPGEGSAMTGEDLDDRDAKCKCRDTGEEDEGDDDADDDVSESVKPRPYGDLAGYLFG